MPIVLVRELTMDEIDIRTLVERIGSLVAERQRLRAASADAAELERNRLELVTAQRELSRLLIARYLPAA